MDVNSYDIISDDEQSVKYPYVLLENVVVKEQISFSDKSEPYCIYNEVYANSSSGLKYMGKLPITSRIVMKNKYMGINTYLVKSEKEKVDLNSYDSLIELATFRS